MRTAEWKTGSCLRLDGNAPGIDIRRLHWRVLPQTASSNGLSGRALGPGSEIQIFSLNPLVI